MSDPLAPRPSPTPFPVVRRLGPTDAAAIRVLVDDVIATRGHSPVDRERLRQVLTGTAPDHLAALGWDSTGNRLAAYVQAVRSVDGWDIDVAARADALPGDVHPHGTLTRQLLRAVTAALAAEDDGQRRLWIFHADADDDRLAAAAGLMPDREIRQLRRPLPLPDALTEAAVTTRPFVPGEDDRSWLAVNNRAFSGHPDQGLWTLETLEAQQREPWFDPDGFLLHEVDGTLAGFCWTKVHRDQHPPLGEIYVIGVDPAFHGRGLGRGLVVAGLDHLARAGLTVAMLYVDASNTPAVALYADLGYAVHHVDRVYT